MAQNEEDTMWISITLFAVVESYILWVGITSWKKNHS